MAEAEPAKHPKIKPTREENVQKLREMLEVVEALRAPDGCPWDREQTHLTLRPYLLEETYELLQAIESGSTQDIRPALRDVLLPALLPHPISPHPGQFRPPPAA